MARVRTLRRVARADAYRELGEAAWAWVRANVLGDDGPWLPSTVDGTPRLPTATPDRSTIYLGTGGLALVLAEVQLQRRLTDEEVALGGAIRASIVATPATCRFASLYFGLGGDATALTVLGDRAAAAHVLRALRDEATGAVPLHGERVADVPPYDVIAGLAGVAMTGVWCGGADGLGLARLAADGLVAAAEDVATGLDWPLFPEDPVRLPNFSHGTAGIAAALAVTGLALGDDALVGAARRGAAHLVAIGDLAGGGLTVPHYVPQDGHDDEEPVTWSWCHGATGTSLLFAALGAAGVAEVDGIPARELRARCLRSVLGSGVPARLRPGFWDNDGQCCGTAGVGDVLLSAAAHAADGEEAAHAAAYLDAATRMGDALVERAVVDTAGARWQFVEHRAAESRLAPGTGWSQGAAGIAAFLLRLARVLDVGLATPVVDRPDGWWAVPASVRTYHRAAT